ncbi:MAG: DUF2848 family protein [Desulfovermiculus sp.]
MIAQFTLQEKDYTRTMEFEFTRMVNAGFVGRNQDEVQKHVQELAAKGIPAPESTPTLYPVVCRALSMDSSIETYGTKTSGEVEYVLLVENEQTVYVALGSDHTDRHLEEVDIPRSKQICPNLITSTVWPLDQVQEHWDELVLKSQVVKDGHTIEYQEGKLELILSPAQLMDFVRSKIPGPLDKTIIYSGTVGMKTEGFVFGQRFAAQLIDPKLNLSLELDYDIEPLSYLDVGQE